MDNSETTDEHIDRNERGPLSKNSQLTRKRLKKANQKEWKRRNAAGKRNADKQKLSQVSSSDTLIDTPIEEGPQLLNGFAVRNNNDELSTEEITEDSNIRESHKNQSTTSPTNFVKKSSHICNNNGNRSEISTTSELKPDQPDFTDQSSTQSYKSQDKDVCSTKKPHVDYNFPSNEEYGRNLRDSAPTAHNLERKDHNKSSILGTTSSIDICSAQAAESSASRPRTDRELNEVWEDTKQNILSLCSSFLYKVFKVNINEIEGMTTVTKKEFKDLQMQIATFNSHFNSEQESLNHSIQDCEQAIKDHTSSEIKGNKSNVEFNFESSSMLNEEKAVNVLSQDDDNSFAFASTSDDTASTTDYSETLEHLDLRFRKLAVDWSSSSENVDTDKINASKYQG
ncbi:unnamed protein product [Mytilus edulis]|uniref:Uncharacterized protein n=1 Tax=Mytilus edulis TaxID=6550 RepID=A0A8S3QRN6_MYTED|nr:unnamed protein product [Mytilus edulis]